MTRKLQIQSAPGPDRTSLVVQGDLDLDSSPQLLEAIRAGLTRQRSVAVDLGAVTYIDSSGVAVLVHGFKLARKQSLSFLIVDPSPHVLSVIKLSQLHSFFDIESSDPPE